MEKGVAEDEDDSEEEEEEEGDAEDFIDVLDMLDGRGPTEGDNEQEKTLDAETQPKAHSPDSTQSGEEEEDSDEDMHEEHDEPSDDSDEDEPPLPVNDAISASEDEDDIGASLQDLQSFITNLDAGQKRKVPDDETSQVPDGEARRQKRRILKERTEAGEENEFAAHSGRFLFRSFTMADLFTLVLYRFYEAEPR